jgi:hypothetical protein
MENKTINRGNLLFQTVDKMNIKVKDEKLEEILKKSEIDISDKEKFKLVRYDIEQAVSFISSQYINSQTCISIAVPINR